MAKFIFPIFLCFANYFTLIFTQSITLSNISNIFSNQNSSLTGGTKFYLISDIFSILNLDFLKILIGNTSANIISSGAQTINISTIPCPYEGKQTISLIYENNILNLSCQSDCSIIYSWDTTPEAVRMINRSGSPNEQISLLTNLKNMLQQNIKIFIINREISYTITTLKDVSTFILTIPSDFEAGYYELNITMVDIGPFYKRYLFDIYNKYLMLYDFECIPMIIYINTNWGSPRGQLISLYGFGFSSYSNIYIYAGFTPCNIISIIAKNYIKCEINEDYFINQKINIAGSGILKKTYDHRDIALSLDYLTMANLYLNDTLQMYFSPNQISETVVNEIKEEYNNTNSLTTDFYEGFLKAPIDGYYRFFLSAQQRALIYISNITNSTNTKFLNCLANVPNTVAFSSIYGANQISSSKFLKKDSFYMIVVMRQNLGTGSHLSVGIEINSSIDYKYQPSYIEFLEVFINYTPQPEILIMSIYNWTNGTFKIVVNGTDPVSLETISLNWNVDNITLRDVIYHNLSDIIPSINIQPLDTNGNFTSMENDTAGYQYTIIFNNFRSNYYGQIFLPQVVILTTDLNATPITSFTQIQFPIAISGNFSLEYNGTILKDIPSNASCTILLNFLSELSVYNQDFTCNFYGSYWENRWYLLKFVNLENSSIELNIDVSNLQGGKPGTIPSGKAYKFSSSKNNSFYYQIPSDMLFTNNMNPQISMQVNGIQSKCPNQNCDYVIREDITPILNNVSQRQSGLMLTLSNYNFITIIQANVWVRYCGINCTLTDFSLPNIICALPFIFVNSCKPIIHIENIGYVLDGPDIQNITLNCLEGQFLQSEICNNCYFSCESCTNSDSTSCLTCIDNKLFYQGSCLDDCPNGSYLNNSINRCFPCSTTCDQCENQSDFCISCKNNLFLFYNVCVIECPHDYFVLNKNCIECDPALFELIDGLKSFCLNLTKVNFTIMEINNPITFILKFSNRWENLTYQSLKKSVKVDIKNLSSNYYKWNVVNDFQSKNDFILTLNYLNYSFLEEDLLWLRITINETKIETKNFILINNQTEILLSSWKICSEQNKQYYNATSNKCEDYFILNPFLEITQDPLKIQFLINTEDEYIKNLICSLSKFEIYRRNISDYNVYINENYDIQISTDKPITGNPKLYIYLDSLSVYLTNTSFQISNKQPYINLRDFYLLDEVVKAYINQTTSASDIGNLLVFLSVIANTIIGSQVGLILKGLMLNDLIHLTKFLDINYPPNVISMYLNRGTFNSWINLPEINDPDKYDLPIMIRFYNISSIFFNNYGNVLIQMFLCYASGLFIFIFINLSMRKYLKSTSGKISKITKIIYRFFVWNFATIYLLSNFLKLLVYSFIKLRFSHRFESKLEILDLLTASFMIFFSVLIIIHFYLKISASFCIGIFQCSKSPEIVMNDLNLNSTDRLSILTGNAKPNDDKILELKQIKISSFSNINHQNLNFSANILYGNDENESQLKCNVKENEKKHYLIYRYSKYEWLKCLSYMKTAFQSLKQKILLFFKYIYLERKRGNDFMGLTNEESNMQRYYLLVELTRYFVLAFFAVIFYGYPLIQITLMIITNLLFLLFTIFSNPFQKKYVYIVTIINELLINICYIVCLVLAILDISEDQDNLKDKMIFGWLIVGSNIFLLYFVFLLNIFRIIIIFLCSSFQKCFRKKNKVAPSQNK